MAEFLTHTIRAAPDGAGGITLTLILLATGILMILAAVAVIAVRSLRWPEAERRDARRMVESLGAILVGLLRGRPPDGG